MPDPAGRALPGARVRLGWLTLVMVGCGAGEIDGPAEPPNPPAGVSVGEIAVTVEKQGQPATRRAYKAPAVFDTCVSSTGILSRTLGWFVEFGIGGRFVVGAYQLTGELPLADGFAVASSSFTYPFTTPPIPTTGALSVLYVAQGRIDGTFEFTGGADSAGVTWTNVVQGSFSATPIAESQCVSPSLGAGGWN